MEALRLQLTTTTTNNNSPLPLPSQQRKNRMRAKIRRDIKTMFRRDKDTEEPGWARASLLVRRARLVDRLVDALVDNDRLVDARDCRLETHWIRSLMACGFRLYARAEEEERDGTQCCFILMSGIDPADHPQLCVNNTTSYREMPMPS